MVRTNTMAIKNTEHLVMEENHMDKLYNSRNPLLRFFHNQRVDVPITFVPNEDNLKILDAGCGEGHLLERLHKKNKNYKLYGVDITKIALNSAKKRIPQAKLSIQDLTKLKFKRNYFDIVLCGDVLEHVYEYKKVIKNLIRVTKKGGLIIISYPNETTLDISRFLLCKRPIRPKDHVNKFNPKYMIKEFSIPIINQRNLPINLPFLLSLETVQVFKK